MSESPGEVIRYQRNHFSTRLPVDCRYSRSHFWLREESPGRWRVGLTGFAARMLGEIVEFDFEVKSGDSVRVGQTVGWIEGFKAVSDLICVVDGQFCESNRLAAEDPEIICKKSYESGWLYEVEGKISDDCEAGSTVDVNGYVEFLDVTIDKMLEKPWQSPTDFAANPNG